MTRPLLPLSERSPISPPDGGVPEVSDSKVAHVLNTPTNGAYFPLAEPMSDRTTGTASSAYSEIDDSTIHQVRVVPDPTPLKQVAALPMQKGADGLRSRGANTRAFTPGPLDGADPIHLQLHAAWPGRRGVRRSRSTDGPARARYARTSLPNLVRSR